MVRELASGGGGLFSPPDPAPSGVWGTRGVVGPTERGPPTEGGLVDLFDLGLASDVAGEMGDRPGFSWEDDTDIGDTVC